MQGNYKKTLHACCLGFITQAINNNLTPLFFVIFVPSLVCRVKYRHRVLLDDIDKRLKEILGKIAKDNGFNILEMETDGDHVHLLIDCSPQHSIPSIIKAVKGVSARLLFKEFPNLKNQLWGGHLWNPSYFVATVSEHTEGQIRFYIQNEVKNLVSQQSFQISALSQQRAGSFNCQNDWLQSICLQPLFS